jgi:omega-6 fatty acid desaturase (delta-12 desaturase)
MYSFKILMSSETPFQLRSGRELLNATKPFANEIRVRSWWLVGSTLALLAFLLAAAALVPWLPLRLGFSVFGGLVIVAFIMFHDYMHGAILRGSVLGRALMYAVGVLLLTPPRSWRESHNYHHANVGRIAAEGGDTPVVTTDIGAYPMMSVEMWQRATKFQRFRYRASRHPVTIFCAYFTIFMGALCLRPTLSNPRKHWPGAFVFLTHLVLLSALWIAGGWQMMFFAYLLPLWIAAAAGAYLFYAQHSFPGARVYTPDEWDYFDAALNTASYFRLGRVMERFTGSIGYHHVHHLNAKIPFYRLSEAMDAIPELQDPVITRLRLRDIYDCFRANLWDPQKRCMVSYQDARLSRASAA